MSDDQLQPQDSLDDRGVDDVLDEGYSPPDREPHNLSDPEWDGDRPTLDQQLAEEEPEVWADEPSADEPFADIDDTEVDLDDAGQERSGRLVDPDQGLGEDVDAELVGEDVGIDGAGASAEEAAVHIIEE